MLLIPPRPHPSCPEGELRRSIMIKSVFYYYQKCLSVSHHKTNYTLSSYQTYGMCAILDMFRYAPLLPDSRHTASFTFRVSNEAIVIAIAGP